MTHDDALLSQSNAALAQLAACLAEPARARMACALLDDRARTATELALIADVAPSTASAHLARLQRSGLLICTPQGRHRYYALADAAAAQAIESLLVLSGPPLPAFEPSTPVALRETRRCYDHLAGVWGVQLYAQLQRLGGQLARDGDWQPSELAWRALGQIGVSAVPRTRRHFACACMDWSERRPHLAGALGAACLQALLVRDWLRADAQTRALHPTEAGRRGWQRWLDDMASTVAREP